jgi:hypothetical protein
VRLRETSDIKAKRESKEQCYKVENIEKEELTPTKMNRAQTEGPTNKEPPETSCNC